MKRFLVYIFILFSATLSAATMRHFNIDVDNVPAEQISEYFEEWFNLPEGTSFVLSNSLSDDEEYTHYCYNQYLNGAIVNGGQILVHATNGFVQYINGIILESEEPVSPVTNKIARKQSSVNPSPEIFIIPVNNETDFRYAYKYRSDELGAYVYVDAENGDTLKISSFIYDAQTKVTTNTIYSGRQKMTVEKSGSQCTYSVTSPRIETINSTNVDFSANTVDMLNTQIQNSSAYKETLADSLSSYLVSIRFDKTNFTWHGSLEYPDLYITIHNSANTLVYRSQVWEKCKDEYLTFNPMLKLDGDTYSIRIYDQDPISDDFGGGFTISSPTKGLGTASLDNFNVTINVTGNPIRDAHWGMEKTLAFYKNVLNRSSYDGNGATIYQFVNPFMPQSLPNQATAICEAPFCMIYGFGDGVECRPLVALDVMAHEFTHMVTAHNVVGGLDYNGESGALNEGFSDIFAVLTEGYTYGSYDWTIGEMFDLQNPFTRSFKNPKAGNPSQPTTYGQVPWMDPNSSQDHGGVHYNSGVLNYWFYLLCNGGSGKNDNQKSYSVQGIGTTKAAKIAYNTLLYGLTHTATFADAREGSINETIKLYGKGSQEHQSVANAWYAVGVGDKYKEVVCKSVPYTESFASSQGDFTVQDVTLPSGFTHIWNWSSQYGMVASCIKNSTKYASESWLISPCIEIPSTGKCVLTFSHAAKFFQNTSQMTLWVSTNYNEGVPSSATWKKLTIPTYPTGQNWNWFDSGDIDLSAYKGKKISLAFKYTSTTSYAPQWEIKNFAVKKASTQDVEAAKSSQQQTEKILRNGQIFILRDDKIFTLTGQEVK